LKNNFNKFSTTFAVITSLNIQQMKFILSALSIFLLIPFSGSAQDNLLSHQLGAFKSLQKTAHGVQIREMAF